MQYEPVEEKRRMSEILPGDHKLRGIVRRRALATLRCTIGCGIGLPLAVGLLLASCAPSEPPILAPQAAAAVAPAGPASAPAYAPTYATVAAVRPLPAASAAAPGQDAAILTAMGLATTSRGVSRASAEIVVRTDGGETLSVVQPNLGDLAPGDRVLVVPGGVTRLVAAPPQS